MKLKIISDGTNTGTKLIDEISGKTIQFVQKITCSASIRDFLVYTTIDLVKVPIDVVAMAEIHEFDLNDKECNVYDAEIRIVTNEVEQKIGDVVYGIDELFIYDNKTQTPISAISDISLEITTDSDYVKAKIKKIKFEVEEAAVGLEPVNSREFGDILTNIYRV
jgi:hypothetical protein